MVGEADDLVIFFLPHSSTQSVSVTPQDIMALKAEWQQSTLPISYQSLNQTNATVRDTVGV